MTFCIHIQKKQKHLPITSVISLVILFIQTPHKIKELDANKTLYQNKAQTQIQTENKNQTQNPKKSFSSVNNNFFHKMKKKKSKILTYNNITSFVKNILKKKNNK